MNREHLTTVIKQQSMAGIISVVMALAPHSAYADSPPQIDTNGNHAGLDLGEKITLQLPDRYEPSTRNGRTELIPMPTVTSGETEINSQAWESSVVKKYGITYDEKSKSHNIPSITLKNRPNLSEGLFVAKLVARDAGIPEKIFLANLWNESMQMGSVQWYPDGSLIVSDMGAIGAGQILEQYHPGYDPSKLREDYAYNLWATGKELLVYYQWYGSGNVADANTWGYPIQRWNGSGPIARLGETRVMNWAFNPPINPETKKPAW